jgi:hypothetical protein
MDENTNKQPFKVENRHFESVALRSLFNKDQCFAQGNFVTKNDAVILHGVCRVVQFGRYAVNPCMFVLDADLSDPNSEATVLSVEFDPSGNVKDVIFGNTIIAYNDKNVPLIVNVPNGTHATFGNIETVKPYSALSEAEKQAVDAIDSNSN